MVKSIVICRIVLTIGLNDYRKYRLFVSHTYSQTGIHSQTDDRHTQTDRQEREMECDNECKHIDNAW